MEIIFQINADRDAYRYVGPHGPSSDQPTMAEALKLAAWVYGVNGEFLRQITTKTEIAEW
tara:strand:- start:690 stop:869 length:180 start_codon:yes stop_codon:yes gene_type:complete